MRFISRIVIFPAAVVACGIATGCFSYHKTVDETPAPVVETAPETTVVPVPATSSSTTTTTSDSNGVVERQKTSTYTAPY
jgi:hypothetical protein